MEQSLFNISKGILTGISPVDVPVIDENDINACCKRRERLDGEWHRVPEDLSSRIANAGMRTDKVLTTQISVEPPLDEMVKYFLKEHHRLLGTRFVNIQKLMNMVVAAHGNEIEIWQQMARIRKGFEELQASMFEHLLFEKDFLSPWIVSDSDAGFSLADTVQTLERQHSQIALKTEAIVAHTGRLLGRPEACEGQQGLYEALMSFKVEVNYHIHVEYTVACFPPLYPSCELPYTRGVHCTVFADLEEISWTTRRQSRPIK
jgi:iron-sulfur cluster repair protein YtfE (RIC family)